MTRRARLANWVGASGLGLLSLSCRHSQDEQSLGKAAQVTRAVEMLRLSSNHDKPLWLKRLRGLACGSDDICELQKTCMGAYGEYLEAIESIELVRHNLEPPDADADTPDASAEAVLKAAALAQNAQRKLRASRNTMRECAENEAVIRQRYKIR